MDDHTHDTFDVRDIDVAARLDSTPIKVRKLIHKHLDELIKFGPIRVKEEGGDEYLLNWSQAVLVAILTNTDPAKNIREKVIRAARLAPNEQSDSAVGIWLHLMHV